MISWANIEQYIQEAINRFLKVRTDLPVKFLSSNFAASGEKLYYAYFEDTKLTNWYKSIKSNREGTFRIIITEDFLNNQTQSIDMAARIPSHIEDEKRVILRIAYSILVNWQRAVIEAYKLAEQDSNKITYINAMAWYGELK